METTSAIGLETEAPSDGPGGYDGDAVDQQGEN